MAEVVIGVGTSHSPQLSVRAADWRVLWEKDENDPRLDFKGLVQKAKPGLEKELTPEKFRQRDEACQAGIKTLGDALQKSKADVVVIFGDDQHEQFQDDNMPTFAIYHGNKLPVVTHTGRNPAAWKNAEERGWAPTEQEYKTESGLAEHLVRALIEEEFDIARCNKLRPEIGVGHAFSFLYRRVLPGSKIPIVPVMVNTYYPPAPSARRCGEVLHQRRGGPEAAAHLAQQRGVHARGGGAGVLERLTSSTERARRRSSGRKPGLRRAVARPLFSLELRSVPGLPWDFTSSK